MVDFVDEGGKILSSGCKTNSEVACEGTGDGEVADTELYVAVVKRTEEVLLKELGVSQIQLERYMPSDKNRRSCRWL
jgi:hypothetical protein